MIRQGLIAVAAACLVVVPSAQAESLTPSPVSDSGFCGFSTATGDVNGDGKDDVVVGCTSQAVGANPNQGSAQVFVRNAGNTGFEGPVELLDPTANDDQCGDDVAVGDVNADGKDDVVMACSGDKVGMTNNAGSVIVFRRKSDNSGFETGQVLSSSPVENEKCGASVAVGEFTGDSLADVVTGCSGGGTDDGGRLVAYTSVAGTSFTGTTLTDPTPADSDRCGTTVAVGDVNGDGRRDIAAGCTGDTNGALVFQHSASSGASFAAPTTVTVGAGGSLCSYAIALGDVNTDGRADLAIGCYQTHATNGKFSGAVTLRTRNLNNNGFDGDQWYFAPDPADDDRCGQAVAIAEAGGDARKDLLVGCPHATVGTTAGAGKVAVFRRLGNNSGFAQPLVSAHSTPVTDDLCGKSLAVGDFDADGGGDPVLGCSQRDASATTSAGGAFALYGTPPTPITGGNNPGGSTPGGQDPPPYVPPTNLPVSPFRPPSTDASPKSVAASLSSAKSVSVDSGGKLTLPSLLCREGASSSCRVIAEALADRRTAVIYSKKAKPKLVSIGKTRFTVAGGKRKAAKLKLGKKGRAVLKRKGKLKATLKFTITDSAGNKRTVKRGVTLKRAKKRRR